MRLLTIGICVAAFINGAIGAALAQTAAGPRKTGMVAADNPQAAMVGAQILAQGGDAADAAVATAFALGVTHSFGSGIGGGGFALVSRADGASTVLDFREVAPRRATENMFVDGDGKIIANASRRGPLAVAVPGELAGLYAMHKRYGKLPWKSVVLPAVKLAREGFIVTPLMHYKITQAFAELRTSVLGPFIADDKGAPLKAGATMRLPLLGKTLAGIAEHGAADFYQGRIGQQIVAAVAKAGGILSAQDLSDYTIKERTVLKAVSRGYEVLSMPPPSSGGLVLLQVLKVLEKVDLKALGHNTTAYLHRLTECLKHGFADRARKMGDPDFVPVPNERFLGPRAIERIRTQFDSQKTLESKAYGARTHSGTDGGTTHLSVLDKHGNAVALTTTINTGFGSRFVAGSTGIVLNNQMDDFVAEPGVPNSFGLVGEAANAVAAGKRPLSSMSPTIVRKNGRVLLVLGGSGGPMIITSTLQTLLNILVFGMTPNEAVSAPRIHHQWMPDYIFVEAGIKGKVLEGLKAKGHRLKLQKRFSAVQVIEVKNGVYRGAADPSKGGRAVDAAAVSHEGQR
jgi:gamma-glutamyltranspeptidase/glutathione hydrolase